MQRFSHRTASCSCRCIHDSDEGFQDDICIICEKKMDICKIERNTGLMTKIANASTSEGWIAHVE